MSQGLFQDFADGYIEVKHSPRSRLCGGVVFVMTVKVLRQGIPSSKLMDSQFSILVLCNLCSESMWSWNFEILVEDYSDTGSPSSITVS